MKYITLKSIAMALSLVGFSPMVLSHGSTEPEHGGIVKIEHELAFELVREVNSTSIYIKDHDQPLNSEKLTGSLTVLASGKKSETPLLPAGTNKMTADIVLSEGDKVLVKVSDGDHHPIVVRYSL